VLRWRAADTLTSWFDGSEVVLDLTRGTWRVRLFGDDDSFRLPSRGVAVHFALGDLAGGDVRTWEGAPGHAPRLVLR
jgi:hypothetical protein